MQGHCACKAVSWRTDAAVLWAGHCHCASCRRAASSPVTSFFGVPSKAVTWQGEVARWSSSLGVWRGFCAACGSQMFYQSAVWPDETHLYAATLDDPARFQPQAHYHWAERVPWLVIDDELPKHSGSADA